MSTSTSLDRPWAYLTGGALAALTVENLAPLALASGWVGPACSGALAAAAVVVAAHGRSSARPPAPIPAMPYVVPGDFAWDMAHRAGEWLESAGLRDIPEDEVNGFLRTRLIGTLRTVPTPPPGSWEIPMDPSTSLLALAFASRSAGQTGRQDTGKVILEGLRTAHCINQEEARRGALADLRTSVTRHFDGDGPSVRIYRWHADRHGTIESFMMGMLASGRTRSGVLSTGEFVWLKAVDRSLWYALNNLGRRSFHVEGLAAMAQYVHEIEHGRTAGLHVDLAVDALAREAIETKRYPAGPSDPEPWA